MDNNIIAVYGSPGSYKTTTALSLARCIASKGSNVVIVGTSTIKPLLPIAVPFESKFSGSLGKALSAVDFDRDVILKNIFMATDKIGILSYNIRENSNSYAVVSPDRMDDLFIQLRQQMGAQIIVDCTSDIVNSKLTAKAVINATHVVELLTCDTNGLVFDGSQEPMSIYNIALYAALAAVCGLFAAGLYNFALVLLKVPSSRTTKAIKAVAARNRPTAAGFKNTYNDISLFVSRFIRLNEFKKKELADSLKIANISMSPELFTARALVRSAGIMLLSVPFFFFLPIIGLLVIVLAVLMYFQEKQKVDSCIKEKRKQIEFDLPRFVYAISQEIQMSHDVISILERHKDNFSPYLNEEIEITIADMRTGNYEAAITRFEGRIGSTNLSEVCRGFIQMIRGDDTSVYWETLAIRFSELQKQYLRNIALKIPPKVHRLSFFLMMSMMLLYVVVLGWELLSNMGVLFG